MIANIQELYKKSIDDGEKRSIFNGLDLSGEVIKDLVLSCVDFINCDLKGATFIGCDLRGSSFNKSKMNNVKLIRCLIFDCEFPKENASITFDNCYREIVYYPTNNNSSVYTNFLESVSKLISMFTSVSTEKLLAIAIVIIAITALVTMIKS